MDWLYFSDSVEDLFVAACDLAYVASGTKSTGRFEPPVPLVYLYHFFCLYYVVSIDLGEGQASTRDQCNRLDRYVNVYCVFCCVVRLCSV